MYCSLGFPSDDMENRPWIRETRQVESTKMLPRINKLKRPRGTRR